MIDKFKEVFLTKEFIIFIIIGCINSLSGIVFSSIYSVYLTPIVSFIFGYLTGIGVSYLLNSYFTFKESLSIKKMIKFAISCVPNFIIQLATVFIMVKLLHLNKLLAYGLAAIIGVPVTFLMVKFFAFARKK